MERNVLEGYWLRKFNAMPGTDLGEYAGEMNDITPKTNTSASLRENQKNFVFLCILGGE